MFSDGIPGKTEFLREAGVVMRKKQSRSEARAEAFKLVFQLETNHDDIEFLIQEMLANRPKSVDNIEYIRHVVYGVYEKKQELEADIQANLSQRWTLSRVSKVALAVLKVAIYEIKYVEDVPHKVAINEAIELEKKYDEPDNSAFVNGVLGGFCRRLKA